MFEQIKDVLDLDYFNNQPNVFTDECIWQSVKAFRNGFVIFSKKGDDIPALPTCRLLYQFYFAIQQRQRSRNLEKINWIFILNIPGQPNVEHLKRIAAIRSLIGKNVLTSVMSKKLSDEIEGTRAAGVIRHGIKYKIARWVFSDAEAQLNNKQISIKHELGKEHNNLSEIVNELKKKVFDDCFNDTYTEHPKYSQILIFFKYCRFVNKNPG